MKFCYDEVNEQDGNFIEKQLICSICGCEEFEKTCLKIREKHIEVYTCDNCENIVLFDGEIKEI